jgi:hypothetical protein
MSHYEAEAERESGGKTKVALKRTSNAKAAGAL